MVRDRSLTSVRNPVVQRFRDAGRGELPGVLLTEGAKLVAAALDAGLEVVEAAVGPQFDDPTLVARLRAAAKVYAECSAELMARLCATETPQGVAALVARPQFTEQDLLGGSLVPLVVAAAGVRDPGNLGALLRSAEAAGATGCLTLRGGADPCRDKAVRGSMGSVFRLPLLHGLDSAGAIAFARRHRLRLVVADGGGRVPHTSADLRRPLLLVLGAESQGVPQELLAAADEHVRIDLCPPVDSLNVAVAAGVLLFEARRQRG